MTYCPQCMTANNPSSMYCTKCGGMINQDAHVSSPSQPVPVKKGKKKKVLAVVLIVLVLAVIFIAAAAASSDDTNKGNDETSSATVDGYYNYTLSTPSSWTVNGKTYSPSPGYVVVVTKINMKNINVTDSGGLGAWDFKLNYAGQTYTAASPLNNPYPGLPSLYMYTTYPSGTQGYDIMLFVIPLSSVDLSQASVIYTGPGNVQYDTTLVVN